MPGFHLIQSTIKCQSSSLQTGSGSMFSPCKCKGSSSVSSSVTFHHSYTLLSGTVSKTKDTNILVSPPICCWPAINLRAHQTSSPVFTSPAHDCLESRAKNRQNKMGKIFFGIIAVVASIVLGKTFFFKFPVHLAARGHKLILFSKEKKLVFVVYQ